MKLPLMTDRDIVFRQHKKILPDGGHLVFVNSIDRPDVPKVKGCIRCTMIVYGYVKPSATIEGAIDYTEISMMDMKGHVPTRLLNMVIASEAQKGVKEMYTYLISTHKK